MMIVMTGGNIAKRVLMLQNLFLVEEVPIVVVKTKVVLEEEEMYPKKTKTTTREITKRSELERLLTPKTGQPHCVNMLPDVFQAAQLIARKMPQKCSLRTDLRRVRLTETSSGLPTGTMSQFHLVQTVPRAVIMTISVEIAKVV